MDPMDPTFQELLVEQVEQHLKRIPSFEGIAIDRLDYSEYVFVVRAGQPPSQAQYHYNYGGCGSCCRGLGG